MLRIALNCAYGGGNCLVCGAETAMGEICKKCQDNLLLSCVNGRETERCSVCGKVLLSERETCMSCRKERVIKSCDFVFPIFPYRMWAKTLMFRWKMEERRGLSNVIALLCHRAIEAHFDIEQEVIVPVPPRPGKIREKGWDQIEETCSILESLYGYRIMKLLRRKDSIQQKKLDRNQRLEESTERYVLSGKGMSIKRENLPKRVIIIDDVMTTGITVESCAKVLKSIGIEKVDVLTLFIVD